MQPQQKSKDVTGTIQHEGPYTFSCTQDSDELLTCPDKKSTTEDKLEIKDKECDSSSDSCQPAAEKETENSHASHEEGHTENVLINTKQPCTALDSSSGVSTSRFTDMEHNCDKSGNDSSSDLTLSSKSSHENYAIAFPAIHTQSPNDSSGCTTLAHENDTTIEASSDKFISSFDFTFADVNFNDNKVFSSPKDFSSETATIQNEGPDAFSSTQDFDDLLTCPDKKTITEGKLEIKDKECDSSNDSCQPAAENETENSYASHEKGDNDLINAKQPCTTLDSPCSGSPARFTDIEHNCDNRDNYSSSDLTTSLKSSNENSAAAFPAIHNTQSPNDSSECTTHPHENDTTIEASSDEFISPFDFTSANVNSLPKNDNKDFSSENNSPKEGSPLDTVVYSSGDSAENSPNVFFPKGRTYDHSSIFHKYKTVDTIEESATNIETPTPAEKLHWVPMDSKYIEKDGYRIGVSPGNFYSSRKGYFVEITNGTYYEIILTNENPIPCNVDVYIDNEAKPDICFRLISSKPRKFEGPTEKDERFYFLRSRDAPLQSGIKSFDRKNGMVKAVFTPQKVEILRSRTVSEPSHFPRHLTNVLEMLGIEKSGKKNVKPRSYTASYAEGERGIDITKFCQGATALRGEQSLTPVKIADPMEVDYSRQVTMRLRLIARIEDAPVPSTPDISSLHPPSVEEILGNEDAAEAPPTP